jgi:hypothetical protein
MQTRSIGRVRRRTWGLTALLGLGLFAGCDAREAPADPAAPPAVVTAPAPELEATPAADEVAPASSSRSHHLRSAINHRRVRHRHASPR